MWFDVRLMSLCFRGRSLAFRGFLPAAVLLIVVAAGCQQPRNTPITGPDPASQGSGSDAAAVVGSASGDGGAVDPNGSINPDENGRCPQGRHICSGKCLSNVAPGSCGGACEACPTIMGGTATCDGQKCGLACPAGKRPCKDACVDATATCTVTCDPGFHPCDNVCVDSSKVSSCGSSCMACPAPPPGAIAICDGMKCDFTCQKGKRCGDKCGECCGDADCPAQPGKVVSCDLTKLTCNVMCPMGQKSCSGSCIDAKACCSDGDCPPQMGKEGKCDPSSHACQYMCAGATKPCGGACIPSGACCDDTGCMGNFACVTNACSTSACTQGFKLCPATSTCIPTAGCCADPDCMGNFACAGNKCSMTACRDGYKMCGTKCIAQGDCCTNDDCTERCQKCSAGRCVPQAASEDLKSECSDAATCKTGKCDGKGGCGDAPNGSQTSGCDQGASCSGQQARSADSCQGGSCRTGGSQSCGHFGCDGTKCRTKCPAGTLDNGNDCVKCGGDGQDCCDKGVCGNNLYCCSQGTFCSGKLNKCFPKVGGGEDCDFDAQCAGDGFGCNLDDNACCKTVCPPNQRCDFGSKGLCRKDLGQPCTGPQDCRAENTCAVNPNGGTNLICQ
jgi:hypothetical protein